MQKDIRVSLKGYNEQYVRDRVSQDRLDFFCDKLAKYTRDIKDAFDDHVNEEFYKKLLNKFLEEVFYSSDRFSINTYGNIDSAIKDDGNLRVIIEAKAWQNKREFPKDSSLVCKGLCELFLYYLNSTRNTTGDKVKLQHGVEIRRLILSNSIEWYIFDANDIERICSGYLEKHYWKFANRQLIYSDNEKFYEDISEYLTSINVDNSLDYIKVNLLDYIDKKGNVVINRNIDLLYKLFDYHFLLKEAYRNAGKTHVLNTHFYEELLYIMGLKEEKKKGKTLIVLDHNIRNSIGWQLYKKYTERKDYSIDKATEKTLELMILWIDRLLFIKLFEGQLISFNSDSYEYHILSLDKIHSFEDLERLFFDVLGKKSREDDSFFSQFSEIPYLNSSLFEKQEIEKDDYNISDLANDEVKIASSSILKKRKINKLPLLDYMIMFLSSYDFGASDTEHGGIQQGKDLIDASVLGLIFEKINGYRDGSYYTPSYITEYIAKESIEKLVVDKIASEFGWSCSDYDELVFLMSKNSSSIEMIDRANSVINNLHIVDPAVGSGHFLVSALNRLIAIKAELGIIKIHGEASKILSNVDIYVNDDTLIVSDPQGNEYRYNKNDRSSQNVQETLFEEKRTLIQNCLFGVDINPKAVAICQLRLWIELLKNAYYKNGLMETLPNIDINIKTGNSLVSTISHKLNNKIGTTSTDNITIPQGEIRKYRKLIVSYHGADKSKKDEIKDSIRKIKHKITVQLYRQGSVVITDDNLWLGVDYGEDLGLYDDAFEWAIEFPQVVNDEGRYLGFDCVLGNPPYISLQEIKDDSNRYERLNYKSYDKKGDIYCLFIELGHKLLSENGILMYITSNKWLKADYGENTRAFICDNSDILRIIDFSYNVFDSATVVVDILMIKNGKNKRDTLSCLADESCKENLESYVNKNSLKVALDETPWLLTSKNEEIIVEKIINGGIPLEKWDISIDYGIKTGCNDAFIITEQVKDAIIAEDSRAEEIIFPVLMGKDIGRYKHHWNGLYLIATFPSKHYNIDDYPSVKNYLINNYGEERLEQSGLEHCVNGSIIKSRKKTSYKWFETQDSIAYWEDFNQPKIIWGNLNDNASYSIDTDGLLLSAPCTFIVPGDYYLLGALNSSVVDWYTKKIAVKRNGKSYEYKPMFIKRIPIPCPSDDIKNEVELLVRQVIEQVANNDPEHINTEKRINDIFYQLYGLTDDEIKTIEK